MERTTALNYEIKHMTKRTIICNNCKETKTYHALGLCKTCYKKQWSKEYMKQPEIKKRNAANMRRYRTDPKFKAHQKREREYNQRPEVKEINYQYEQTPERKQYHKEHGKQYRQTPKGKKIMQNHNAYINLIYKPRHRDFELMPDVYPDEIPTTPHHLKNDINNPESELWFYMFVPRITHEYVGGATRNNEHWRHNAKWIEKIYCMNIKNFLDGKDFMTN